MLNTSAPTRLGRGFVILAPPLEAAVPFPHLSLDIAQHRELLSQAQRLRGRIYLKDGAIDARQLTADGRHVQSADARSWHLLTLDQSGSVTACIRYLAHPSCISYSQLEIGNTLANQPAEFSLLAERIVKSDLARARHNGFSYVELGGWVVDENLRCSTEAIRMLLMMYALSQLMGGAIALGTATTRHSSSTMLRRIGGRTLCDGKAEVPAYYDPIYDCQMEMLSFDSRMPNPRYSGWIREFREALMDIPIISPVQTSFAQNLLALTSAVDIANQVNTLRTAGKVA